MYNISKNHKQLVDNYDISLSSMFRIFSIIVKFFCLYDKKVLMVINQMIVILLISSVVLWPVRTIHQVVLFS